MHGHSHDCWLPGNARNQGIRSHGIELSIPEYFGFGTTKANDSKKIIG